MKQSKLSAGTESEYHILSKSLNRSGFTLEQIDRTGNVAFYVARNPKDYEQIKGYILIKIRIKTTTRLPSGTITPKREIFPAPSKFGEDGWFYMPESFLTANRHYNDLVKKMNQGSSLRRKSKKVA